MTNFFTGFYFDSLLCDFVLDSIYSDKESVQKSLDKLPDLVKPDHKHIVEHSLESLKEYLLKQAIEQAKKVKGL